MAFFLQLFSFYELPRAWKTLKGMDPCVYNKWRQKPNSLLCWQKASKLADFTFPKAVSLVDIAELHSSTQIISIYIEEKEKNHYLSIFKWNYLTSSNFINFNIFPLSATFIMGSSIWYVFVIYLLLICFYYCVYFLSKCWYIRRQKVLPLIISKVITFRCVRLYNNSQK